jgi:hypothetical protein
MFDFFPSLLSEYMVLDDDDWEAEMDDDSHRAGRSQSADLQNKKKGGRGADKDLLMSRYKATLVQAPYFGITSHPFSRKPTA